jgi:sensor histidine kinase regulating citrate/malate metabolism
LAAFIVADFNAIPVEGLLLLNIYRLQARSITFLLYLIVIVFIKHYRAVNIRAMSTKIMFVLYIQLGASILIIQQFVFHFTASDGVISISEVIPLLSIIIVNIIIFVMIEAMIKQDEKNLELFYLKAQHTAQHRHINQLMETYDQIRDMSHNVKQKIDVLYTLCLKQEYEKLLEQLSEMSDKQYKSLVVDTENIMLDAILTSKQEESARQCIEYKAELDVESNMQYIDMELCILLGNALDNAIEACNRSADKKIICLKLTATPSQFLCYMKNTVGLPPISNGNFFESRKKDRLQHGIGFKSMKQICDRLGASLAYEISDTYFELWIEIQYENLV